MDINDYAYDLPAELISQKAIEPRDACKLMVINRETNEIQHKIFNNILDILDKKCVLVLNDTKVFPARLFGVKETGGKTELLLLRQNSLDSFYAIGKGSLHPGQKIIINDNLSAKIEAKNDQGEILLRFNLAGIPLLNAIDSAGHTPLPPYIKSDVSETKLREQYQTVYAKEKGSAAAPTAGLHFTEELLKKLEEKGVEIEKITLHVGLGTFKPVSPEQIKARTLHSERYSIDKGVANRLNNAKRLGKKIIAVGTTTCRTLESQTNDQGILLSGEGETSIFIQPGYQYKFVDGLITNFHLPKTSLLMMVTALVSAPNSPTIFKKFSDSLIYKAYTDAIKEKYLFFSFGDAMLIL